MERTALPEALPGASGVENLYNLDVAHDPRANFIGPLEVWDTHYVRMIDDSGFIDALYQGQLNRHGDAARDAAQRTLNASHS
jgi:hypothetical protein